MKIKKIIALCKAAHCIVTYLTPSETMMWIGDGAAFYPGYGVPLMNGADLLRMNDVDENKIGEYNITTGYLNFAADTKLRDYDRNLIPLDAQIVVDGVKLQPFVVEGDPNGKIYYIDTDYMAPFTDNRDEKQYILKFDSRSVPLVMVFAGLTPLAAIAVIRPNYEHISRVCGAMYRNAELQIYHTPRIEEEQVTLQEGQDD